jgi:hypothetical protein
MMPEAAICLTGEDTKLVAAVLDLGIPLEAAPSGGRLGKSYYGESAFTFGDASFKLAD